MVPYRYDAGEILIELLNDKISSVLTEDGVAWFKTSVQIHIQHLAQTSLFGLRTKEKVQCRCMPDDACWPNSADWASLNATTGGKLISTVPLGRACHFPEYNAPECRYLQSQWTSPFLQYVFDAQSLSVWIECVF